MKDTRRRIIVQKETHDKFIKTDGRTHDDKLNTLLNGTKQSTTNDVIVTKLDSLKEDVGEIRNSIERKTGY